LVSGRAVRVKSLSSQTDGEEYPIPGTFVFQRTFVTESHLAGRLTSSLVPSWSGPRQQGQFCAKVSVVKPARSSKTEMAINLFFTVISFIKLLSTDLAKDKNKFGYS
jgi:hypothetical protein